MAFFETFPILFLGDRGQENPFDGSNQAGIHSPLVFCVTTLIDQEKSYGGRKKYDRLFLFV